MAGGDGAFWALRSAPSAMTTNNGAP